MGCSLLLKMASTVKYGIDRLERENWIAVCQLTSLDGLQRRRVSWVNLCFSAWVSTLNMGLINKGLTLETSAKHHIPQATNIPYQPLLIKPIL